MYFARVIAITALFFSGCGAVSDDLRPSGNDLRVSGGASQAVTNFTLTSIDGKPVTLSEVLLSHNAAVVYFTMWCPVCDSHMSHMRRYILPDFPDTAFLIVDFVSGSVEATTIAANSNGYTNSRFTILADVDHIALNLFNATMGTTIVVSKNGDVVMNEDYKDGVKLRSSLEATK